MTTKKTPASQQIIDVALTVAATLEKMAATKPTTFDAALLRSNATSLKLAAATAKKA